MSLDKERSRLLHELERLGAKPSGVSMDERTQLRLHIFLAIRAEFNSYELAADEACKIADRLLRTEIESAELLSYGGPLPVAKYEPPEGGDT